MSLKNQILKATNRAQAASLIKAVRANPDLSAATRRKCETAYRSVSRHLPKAKPAPKPASVTVTPAKVSATKLARVRKAKVSA